jgi:hypothetical protein
VALLIFTTKHHYRLFRRTLTSTFLPRGWTFLKIVGRFYRINTWLEQLLLTFTVKWDLHRRERRRRCIDRVRNLLVARGLSNQPAIQTIDLSAAVEGLLRASPNFRREETKAS